MDTWIEAAVRDLEMELKRLDLEADAKQAAAEAAQAACEAVLAEQATVRRMLEWTRARQSQRAEEPARTQYAVGSLALGTEVAPRTHADLCMQVLTQVGRTIETVEVRKRLEQAGYSLNQGQVRSALKYLGKKKNPPVESVRPGAWRLRSAPGYVPLEPASVPAVNGTGGNP